MEPTKEQTALERQKTRSKIMEAVTSLLERNASWWTTSIEVNALLRPDVTVERTLLTKQERKDLVEYLQILGSTSGTYDYSEDIVVTINTIAADGRGNPGGRRRVGFLSDFEQEQFNKVATTFHAEVFSQGKTDRIYEVYKMRHTVI